MSPQDIEGPWESICTLVLDLTLALAAVALSSAPVVALVVVVAVSAQKGSTPCPGVSAMPSRFFYRPASEDHQKLSNYQEK